MLSPGGTHAFAIRNRSYKMCQTYWQESMQNADSAWFIQNSRFDASIGPNEFSQRNKYRCGMIRYDALAVFWVAAPGRAQAPLSCAYSPVCACTSSITSQTCQMCKMRKHVVQYFTNFHNTALWPYHGPLDVGLSQSMVISCETLSCQPPFRSMMLYASKSLDTL